ncbi:hypothetical protein CROQUDRAFT_536294 [Cronartium quercuum f. sp. fusiforme G11]|uniref:Uncharacterized protein n=1 Tax=Cronartium quercuum f. sp. fusiforme G11 TaxID=708437 RepID=A0A9P6TCX9_9BASI|nr:hypothetical protein CROQUDRAFT_536294 [Cronartium quercuum f. sp. fusiforme G11]
MNISHSRSARVRWLAMGRKRSQARKARHGQKPPNFNPKTSPSAVKSRLLLELADRVGCVYARNHRKRRAVKTRLAEDLALTSVGSGQLVLSNNACRKSDASDIVLYSSSLSNPSVLS